MKYYLKSEQYRLAREKALYLTSLVCLGLLLAVILILAYFHQADPGFTYGNSRFLYLNILSLGFPIVLVGSLFTSVTAGGGIAVLKQSISFGISRKMIFWTKLMLTLGAFLLLCGVGMALAAGLGESFLQNDPKVLNDFLIGAVNMAPLVLSGLILSYVLRMAGISGTVTTGAVMVVYWFSGSLAKAVIMLFAKTDAISRFFPSELLADTTDAFASGKIALQGENWLVGGGIAVLSLFIGWRFFAEKDIQ